ncbi:MAG TPA: ElyC/SanA/YdcF family protein [Herpetosiphonaceae bacterium]
MSVLLRMMYRSFRFFRRHLSLRRTFGLLLCAILLPLMSSWYVATATAQQRYSLIEQVPQQRVAIVFGAGVRPDGRLSRMLAERVQAASDLYQAGRVEKLLMTGDNGRVEYDEVTAMKRYAVELGVRAEDITLDYAGFSTYESCVRAKDIFGVAEAVLVTQRFHLPRAVYTCQVLGITAIGLGTPDWGTYREDLLLQYTFRESLATLKALWEVHVTRPEPTFRGPFEGIS